MATHKTGTRDEWLAARLALLEADKDYSRRGDELAQRRQELPSVAIEQPCTTGLIAPHRHDEYAELKAGQSDDLATGSRSLG
jgi:predicted dithiol-disulfide oxidoreductase (DUF899 family)